MTKQKGEGFFFIYFPCLKIKIILKNKLKQMMIINLSERGCYSQIMHNV